MSAARHDDDDDEEEDLYIYIYIYKQVVLKIFLKKDQNVHSTEQ